MKKSVSKRYSDSELEKFKQIILKKIEIANNDLRLLRDSYSNASSNGTDDTYSSFKSFEELKRTFNS